MWGKHSSLAHLLDELGMLVITDDLDVLGDANI